MQEVKELFSHQEGDQVVAKSGSQKPVIALIVACGQIVAGKGSATELQQAPVSAHLLHKCLWQLKAHTAAHACPHSLLAARSTINPCQLLMYT